MRTITYNEHVIRVVEHSGVSYAVAKDVADALGIGSASLLVKRANIEKVKMIVPTASKAVNKRGGGRQVVLVIEGDKAMNILSTWKPVVARNRTGSNKVIDVTNEEFHKAIDELGDKIVESNAIIIELLAKFAEAVPRLLDGQERIFNLLIGAQQAPSKEAIPVEEAEPVEEENEEDLSDEELQERLNKVLNAPPHRMKQRAWKLINGVGMTYKSQTEKDIHDKFQKNVNTFVHLPEAYKITDKALGILDKKVKPEIDRDELWLAIFYDLAGQLAVIGESRSAVDLDALTDNYATWSGRAGLLERTIESANKR
jgi:hypothetical protein